MPLDVNILKTEILKITDASNPIHQGFPKDINEAGLRWAAAVDTYASSVVPTSYTLSAAKQQLAIDLLNVATGGTSAFILALTNYSITIASGMLPTFNGFPPPTPVVLQPIFTYGLSGASANDVAILLSNAIDAWFKTGTAINVSTSIVSNWN